MVVGGSKLTNVDSIAEAVKVSDVFIVGMLTISSSFSKSSGFILNQVVYDKESRMRETLRIMSLGKIPYMLGYYLTQGFFAFFTSVCLFYAMHFAVTEPDGNSPLGDPTSLLIGLILYGQSLVALSMALSTLFTDSKLST